MKRILLITSGALILAVVLVILFISPITKYLVEKYDEKYTGRKITMDWAYVNPFTGYIHFSNVNIYELKSDSVFLSIHGLSGIFEMRKMFYGTYEISQLTLDHPRCNFIQHKKEFNFTSLIDYFKGDSTDTTTNANHFNILKIKITEGEFHYLQEEIPVTYFIKSANMESDGKLWNADSVGFKIFFLSGPGSGTVEAKYTVNFKTLDYHYAIVIHDFDLAPVEQYLKAIANYGTFSAHIDANLVAKGNFTDAQDVNGHGQLAINNFHIGKNKGDDYAAFDKLVISVLEMSPKNKKYIFDTIALFHPYIKFEQFDYLDNIERMFGEKGANIMAEAGNPERFNLIIEIARYIKVVSKNIFHSYYKVNNLSVSNGDIKYNDYSVNEKFSMDLDPIYINADSIDKKNDRVEAMFKSGIKPFGNLSVSLSISPKDSADFDMKYNFQKMPVAMFNPYTISYTSFPLDRGTIELNGAWEVRNGNIQSNNHVLIIDPRVTKRIKNKNTNWLPLPLIMSFVREYGNVIDYQIPITGSLKNPKFHLHDVLSDVLGNIFIKPPTTAYRMEVKKAEAEIEKSLTLKWAMRQNKLRPEQEKFISKMADFLEKNPDATIDVYPKYYAAKEKEYILFFEAKKKYYLSVNLKDHEMLNEDDTEKIDKMSVKDSVFNHYLNQHNNDTMLFTIQDKCKKYIGVNSVNSKYNLLTSERENAFISFFGEQGIKRRIKIHTAENTIPYNGFSYYEIKYEGELPKSLTKAYQKIQELNDEDPRKKYERGPENISGSK